VNYEATERPASTPQAFRLLFIDAQKNSGDIQIFIYPAMQKPLFVPTSNEEPQLLTISFEDDPQGSLGAQLINCDKVRFLLQHNISRVCAVYKTKYLDRICYFLFRLTLLDFYFDIVFERENHLKCFLQDLLKLDGY
jgi:hypothetical protein